MIEFIIFEGTNNSKAFKLSSPMTETELAKIMPFTYSITTYTFPNDLGDKIYSQPVGLFKGTIMNYKFIMRIKNLKATNWWEFRTRWNHKILSVQISGIKGEEWHQNAVNNLLESIKNKFLDGRIHEKTVSACTAFLNLANSKNVEFLTDALFLTAASLIQPIGYEMFHVSYTAYLRRLGIPHSAVSTNINISNRDFIIEIRTNKLEPNNLMPLLSDLIITIENRSDIEIISLVDFKQFLIQNLGGFYEWYNDIKIIKLAALLKIENLTLQQINVKMKEPKSSIKNKINYSRCFISYSSIDSDFARKLHDDLIKNGIQCWFAEKEMLPGKKTYEQVEEALNDSDKVILVLSHSSMKSEWVKTEIANTRSREIMEKCNLLVPVSIIPFNELEKWKNLDSDIGKDSAKEIREYFIPDFTKWKDYRIYNENFQRLLLALEI